jgi:hypothetical protein
MTRLMPSAFAALVSATATASEPWSVRLTAGISSSAGRFARSRMRHAPSRIDVLAVKRGKGRKGRVQPACRAVPIGPVAAAHVFLNRVHKFDSCREHLQTPGTRADSSSPPRVAGSPCSNHVANGRPGRKRRLLRWRAPHSPPSRLIGREGGSTVEGLNNTGLRANLLPEDNCGSGRFGT